MNTWNSSRVTRAGTNTMLRARSASVPRHQRISSYIGDVFAAFVGLAGCYILKSVGEFPGPEFLLVPYALIFFVRRPQYILHHKGRRTILIFLGAWLLEQIVTDIYRQSPTLNWMRGDALIIFLAIDWIAFVYLMAHNTRRQVIYLFFGALGSIASTKISPSAAFHDYPWKFGYAPGVTMIFALISCYLYTRKRYFLCGLSFFIVAGISLIEDYRSFVLILLLTMALVLPVVPERIGRLQLLPRANPKKRIFVLLVLVLVAGEVANVATTCLAAAGVLGEGAQQKNYEQSHNKFGILMGGRPDFLVGLRAVWDSPILGHGSWASDPKYQIMMQDMAFEYGTGDTAPEEPDEEREGIPSHSHLLGAWVSAGIVGGIFWIYILVITIKASVRSCLIKLPLSPLYVYLLISFIWENLFSPLGSFVRITAAFTIMLILDVLALKLPDFSFAQPVSRLGRLPASYLRSGYRFSLFAHRRR